MPSWAKDPTKPSYTKSEVGLGNVDNVKQYSATNPPPYPVTSVNNKTGAVTLNASEVGADASGTAASAVAAHDSNASAHADIRQLIAAKVDNTQLTSAVNSALAQAKASGEFKGEPGKTPIRGIDYFTEADKSAIIVAVLEAIGTPIYGVIDENNHITFTGKGVPDGSYTCAIDFENGTSASLGSFVKDTAEYVNVYSTCTNCSNKNTANKAVKGGSYSAEIIVPDGYALSTITVKMGGVDITASSVSGGTISIVNVTGDIVITAVATEKASEPINQIPISRTSTAADAPYYVGTNGEKGYKTNTRLSGSTGNETTSSATGLEVTGFIPFKYGQTIYIKNITFAESSSQLVGCYDKDGAKIALPECYKMFGGVVNGEVASSVDIKQYYGDRDLSTITHIRISASGIDENSILTVAQPIE